MMRIATIAILMCLMLAGTVLAEGGAEVSGEELLKRAKAVRVRAESDLAEARQRRLDRRQALASTLDKAYARLDAAKARAAATRKALAHFEAQTGEASRQADQLTRRMENMIAQVASSSGVEVSAFDTIDAIEENVWAAFSARLARIEGGSRILVATETVVDRAGNPADVPVIRLGSYGAYACGESRDTCGLLRSLADGRQLVAGPYLDHAQGNALRSAAGGNLTHLPVDVDGDLVDRPAVEPASMETWLTAGGVFIIPIVVVGALGVILILERVVYLVLSKASPSLTAKALTFIERQDVEAARKLLGTSRTPTARVLLAGIDALAEPPDSREAAMESALLAEAPRLERSLSLLGALAGVAPLLGLLGTVSGMISTFDTISTVGTGNARLLSGGISEALITTQLGLMVAIPLLLVHAWLRRWVERREAVLEYGAIQFLGLARRPEGGGE